MARDTFSAKNIFMILFFAIAAIYLFGQFSETVACTTEDVANEDHGCTVVDDDYLSFITPTSGDLESSTLWIIKIAFLGLIMFLSYGVTMKLAGGNMGRKHIFSLVLLGIAVYFIWVYVIDPSGILGAESFNDITWKLAKKIGLM